MLHMGSDARFFGWPLVTDHTHSAMIHATPYNSTERSFLMLWFAWITDALLLGALGLMVWFLVGVAHKVDCVRAAVTAQREREGRRESADARGGVGDDLGADPVVFANVAPLRGVN